MINVVSEKNIINGRLISKQSLYELLEQDTAKIYEVIRVIDKKPIFLKEHLERLNNSLNLSGYNETLEFNRFKASVELLIAENEFTNCNIRVSFFIKDDEPVVLMYYVKSSYPTAEMFKNGIYVITLKKHRKNPNVKFFETELRDSIDKSLSEKGAFEAILVNNDDTISEGSKSNVFFVCDDKLVTSMDSEVLLGVTRGKVVEVCERNGIIVEKRRINISELKKFDGAFITGTSNNVLPIRAIDDIVYDSVNNKTVNKASELYLAEMAKEYK